jgi:hypothetical protein
MDVRQLIDQKKGSVIHGRCGANHLCFPRGVAASTDFFIAAESAFPVDVGSAPEVAADADAFDGDAVGLCDGNRGAAALGDFDGDRFHKQR